MPYRETVADRMRRALKAHAGISEKRMMGGICLFLYGNMLAGTRTHKDGIDRFMFRVGKAQEAAALADPAARPVVMGGRRMGGFIHVDVQDCDDADLGRWLGLCLAHAAELEPKT